MHNPLTEEQLSSFRRDGYLVSEKLLDDNRLTQLRAWVAEVADWPAGGPGQWIHYHETTSDGPALARTEGFLPFHEGLRQLLSDSLLSGAVAQLFGEPARVFKEKINYKQPGGGGFAPHQDAIAYPLGSLHLTCLVAVDDNTLANGCLWFAPRHHTAGLLPVDDTGCLTDEVAARLTWVPAPVRAGGAVFFDSFIPHKSPPNASRHARRSLYITYNKSSEGDLRTAYYAERNRAMAASRAAGTKPRISTVGHFQGEVID